MEINESDNRKQIWRNLRTLTSYQDENSEDILPSYPKENVCYFSFGGKHLEKEDFDELARVTVENEINQSKDFQQTKSQELESDEIVTLQKRSLQKGKARGSDMVYSGLLLAAGQGLKKACSKNPGVMNGR